MKQRKPERSVSDKLRRVNYWMLGESGARQGWFHCWYHESMEGGTGLWAIVEKPDGNLLEISPDRIRFCKSPKLEGEEI